MADDPVEGMARAIARAEAPHRGTADGYATATWGLRRAEARAAWAYALATLHAIDPALLRLAFGDFRGAMISWQAAVRAFARTHGLEPPGSQECATLPLIAATLALAREAHAGQTERGSGRPYAEHVARVWIYTQDLLARLPADRLGPEDRDAAEHVALLHDADEDTALTVEQIAARGYPPAVTDRLRLLSKRHRPEGETYRDWIGRIAGGGDLVAILVKLADNADNGDPARIAALPPEERGIALRYARARSTLLDALGRVGLRHVAEAAPGSQECAPASEGPEIPSRPESATSGPARGPARPSGDDSP